SAAMVPQRLVDQTDKRLILTTPQDIRALDCSTGRVLWKTPGSSVTARSCVWGSLLFWPTPEGVHILNTSDGEQDIAPPWLRHLPVGDSYRISNRLLIRTPQGLQVYKSETRNPKSETNSKSE